MEKITFQRNMDNGYGEVHCIQKQDFQLNEIHNYFKIETIFENVETLLAFFEEKQEEDDYDFFNDVMCNLNDTEDSENFNATANPRGYGNNVDCLIVTYDGKVIFEY